LVALLAVNLAKKKVASLDKCLEHMLAHYLAASMGDNLVDLMEYSKVKYLVLK
jgi:hypothetical protein